MNGPTALVFAGLVCGLASALSAVLWVLTASNRGPLYKAYFVGASVALLLMLPLLTFLAFIIKPTP